MQNNVVDSIIIDVLSASTHEKPLCKVITEERVLKLLDLALGVFKAQKPMVEVNAPIKVCGDIHGQFPDLLRLFHRGGWPPTANYLFLGDYVDRGRFSIETIVLLLAYKVKFPCNFFLLRGNHECEFVNKTYGFYEECQKRYQSVRMYAAFQDVFNWLPLTGLIATKILCMHGGLSPLMTKEFTLDTLRKIERPTEGKEGLVADLLWADPISGLSGFMNNQRGAGCGFGRDSVLNLCSEFQLDLVCRAHQVVQDGYEFFAGRKLVTIFSAPHYCGQFDNCAAFMSCDEKLQCSFEILRPTTGRLEIREKPLLKDETN
ncbi:Serine/threonine-protein phosphatase [Caenorhabditis elegans]|uniref:Serine/threonine-protein phosphatase n=1 Tax=Caenorhabditis elegans TaxID=6239 RepID=Q9U3L7_CAEEL|nr:Serine/threonine-protein phosphatase [Caenorhabditis elegans]CAB62794.1 Serine/threonine-protein phosphatase [Caenorhabditis elegans]|eukprot:NP_502650.1 Serine/threonine-protein phosphatase [Caenorhabditis elegans]